jgi:hypothetical protein
VRAAEGGSRAARAGRVVRFVRTLRRALFSAEILLRVQTQPRSRIDERPRD